MADDVLPPLGDTPPDELRRQLRDMADWAAGYRIGLRDRAIVPEVRPGDVTALLPAAMPEESQPMSQLMAELDRVIMPGVLHWGHPAFLGYFGSTSNGPALVGEIAAAALNVSAMTWKTSPAATELETVVLRWLAQLVGLPAELTGIVYDTASVATMHALAAAREVTAPGARARGIAAGAGGRRLVVLTGDQAHSSVEKAMIVLGLGESGVVRVPGDADFRMTGEALRAAMDAAIGGGATPMAVVATAGSTSTASVDELPAIAALCRERDVWLHVDAAYGGAIGALPEGRALLAGMEQADSVVINPHKWLFVPLDFSALYVRRPELVRRVFALVPEYLEGDAVRIGSDATAHDRPDVDYMDYSLQLGRRFRALKAWMVFSALGRSGIEARLREHCRLAALFAGWVRDDPRFELAAPQRMAVVCFRLRAPGGDAEESDALNASLVERVNASGQAYVTRTRLGGRTCVRVGIGNIATTEGDVRRAWECIAQRA